MSAAQEAVDAISAYQQRQQFALWLAGLASAPHSATQPAEQHHDSTEPAERPTA